jgi:hypothetical protein
MDWLMASRAGRLEGLRCTAALDACWYANATGTWRRSATTAEAGCIGMLVRREPLYST